MGVYGWPDSRDKHHTWDLMKRLSSRCTEPILMFGDFNEIVAALEKEGGVVRCERQMDGFREAIDT
ncbi:polyprotein [Bienertia sinuspersici]